MTRVFIDGKEGTTGLRIYERLGDMNGFEILSLSDSDRKDLSKRKAMINKSDITFLCLPDEAAREAVAMAEDNVRIIDASTAHRTDPGWSYGFPELSQNLYDGIKTSKRVCVPGCHASGFIALVFPLIQAGLLDNESQLSCFSLTGYSGGGKSMISEYSDDNRPFGYSSPRQYALGQNHKHLPEITAVTGLKTSPVFTPVVADYYSGMIVSVPLHKAQLATEATASDIAEVYKRAYAGKGVVRPQPFTTEDGAITANTLAGRDTMEISVEGNNERMTLTARFDNLGKGASGAAIQCMNIMLGRNEFEGLNL